MHRWTKVCRVAQLVCGGAADFAAELDGVLDYDWPSILSVGSKRSSIADVPDAEILALAIDLIGNHSVAFWRRFFVAAFILGSFRA